MSSINEIIKQLEAQKASIERALEALHSVEGISGRAARKTAATKSSSPAKNNGAKRPMSPEGREKIAAAQRKRWAKQKKKA